AAFIQTMCTEQPLVEMRGCGCGNVFFDDGLEIRRVGRGERAATRLYDAGDAQRIPKRLAETVFEQEALLRGVRKAGAHHQLRRGIDQLVPALLQRVAPGPD